MKILKTIRKLSLSKRFALAAGVLIAFIILLAIVAETTSASLREVSLEGTNQNAELVDQQLTFRLSRPLENDSLTKENIQVDPAVGFEFISRGEQLIVAFTQALAADTAYQIKVVDAVDIFGEPVAEFSHEFRTKSLRIVYLENNPAGELDRIMATDLDNTNPIELYVSYDIIQFSKHEQTICIIKQNGKVSEAILIDLETAEQTVLFGDNYDVYDAHFTSDGSKIYLLAQTVEAYEDYVIPLTGKQVYMFATAEKYMAALDLGEYAVDIDDLQISPAGDAILIKSAFDSIYYLVDVYGGDDAYPLGRFMGSSGFNLRGNEILFTSIFGDFDTFPYIELIDDKKQKITLTDKQIFTQDPAFFSEDDRIAYSKQVQAMPDSKGLFGIVVSDRESELLTFSQADLGLSIEYPKVSPDNRYILVESYTLAQIQDYENQRLISSVNSKPSFAKLKVYDLETKTFLESFAVSGIEAVWE